MGLPVPDLVVLDVPPELGAAEPDPEIQDLLRASVGLNAGMDFLPGALPLDHSGAEPVDPAWAADVVWFDALVTNVDRTARNPNMLVWHGRTWLIDHGAALYLHHSPGDLVSRAGRPFPMIRDHVLLGRAGPLPEADARLAPRLGREALAEVVAGVPDAWLDDGDATPEDRRREYVEYLCGRLAARAWVADAEEIRRGV
ncbi:MAG TPA: HipA family kinase [Miltoncostaeaceae bacterium]|nr:HipA family kinase [Miltoncostaeaceae bacterium]